MPSGARPPSTWDHIVAVARRDTGRPALQFGEQQLSYGWLCEQAERFGARLRDAGIGTGERVFVAMDPCPDLIATLLGTWAAGCAFVPLSPDHPAARRELILACARPRVHVEFDARAKAPRVHVVAPGPATTRQEPPWPEDLAYLIFTSGSTGRPKGVAVEHRSLLALLLAAGEAIGLGSSDIVPLVHDIAFDFSIWEVFGTLVHGGLLVIPTHRGWQPAALWQSLIDHRVTVLNQTPTAFASLLATGLARRERPTHLRAVVFGGERLAPASLRRFMQRLPEVRLVNMYGITETTVHVTARELSPDDLRWPERSPIGDALPHLELLLLDEAMTVVEAGQVGELYVGGAGLARGYFDGPALTAERFVPHPFAQGRRLYRTGDRAVVLPGSGLCYVGRCDDQLEIRAHRIEPAEVERVLMTTAGVELAVVVASPGPDGHDRLVASLVGQGDALIERARARATAELPSYMVPSLYELVQELPRTRTGKIDRARLVADWHSRARSSASSRPRVERSPDAGIAALVDIWAEVLDLPCHADTDFFAAGGTSLLVASAAAMIDSRLGHRVSPVSIYEHPTPRGLAAQLDLASRPTLTEASPTRPSTETTAAERSAWMLGQLAARSLVVPVRLELRGPLDADALGWALEQLPRRHEGLRGSLCLRGDNLEHSLVAERPLPLVTADARAERGPATIEARLVALGQRTHRLELDIDHQLVDAAAIEVLFDDLVELYRAAVEGAPLPPWPAQRSELVSLRSASRPARERERVAAYWREQLARPPAPDVSATVGDRGDRGVDELRVSRAGIEARLGRSVEGGVELAALIAGALARALARTGVRIGLPIADRSVPAIACAYELCVLILEGSTGSLKDAQSTAREVLLAALANVGPSVDELRALAPPGPLYDLVLNVLPPAAPAREAGGLSFAWLERPLAMADDAPIMLYVWLDDDALIVRANYSAATLRGSPVRFILASLRTQIDRDVVRPDGPRRGQRRARALPGYATEPALSDPYAATHGPRVLGHPAQPWSAAQWAHRARATVDELLDTRGAILLRGTQLHERGGLGELLTALGETPEAYVEGTSPRRIVRPGIYSSTEYPASESISLHNELSYAHRWPRRLYFLAVQVAAAGGQTPIASSIHMLEHLPGEIRERFEARGVTYYRSMHAGLGPGLSWQEAFETSDRTRIEAWLRAGQTEWRWTDAGGLETRQTRPALRTHPRSGARLWFCQADQWLLPGALLSTGDSPSTDPHAWPAEGLALHASFGDGGAISAADLIAISRAFEPVTTTFDWAPGDVLILDNMAFAHGRRPFGGERQIHVAMTGTHHSTEVFG